MQTQPEVVAEHEPRIVAEDISAVRAQAANETKSEIMARIKARVDRLSELHTKETNIATRYDYRLKIEELVGLYNELVGSEI